MQLQCHEDMYLRLRKSALIKASKLRSKDVRILRTQLLWRWSHRSHGLMSCSKTKWILNWCLKNESEFGHLQMLKKSSSLLWLSFLEPRSCMLAAVPQYIAVSCICSTLLYAHLHGFLNHSLHLQWHHWFLWSPAKEVITSVDMTRKALGTDCTKRFTSRQLNHEKYNQWQELSAIIFSGHILFNTHDSDVAADGCICFSTSSALKD